MEKHHIKLTPTEQSLLHAAATIFPAFVSSGKYQPAQEKELRDKSISLAISLAEQIDTSVSAGDEIP